MFRAIKYIVLMLLVTPVANNVRADSAYMEVEGDGIASASAVGYQTGDKIYADVTVTLSNPSVRTYKVTVEVTGTFKTSSGATDTYTGRVSFSGSAESTKQILVGSCSYTVENISAVATVAEVTHYNYTIYVEANVDPVTSWSLVSATIKGFTGYGSTAIASYDVKSATPYTYSVRFETDDPDESPADSEEGSDESSYAYTVNNRTMNAYVTFNTVQSAIFFAVFQDMATDSHLHRYDEISESTNVYSALGASRIFKYSVTPADGYYLSHWDKIECDESTIPDFEVVSNAQYMSANAVGTISAESPNEKYDVDQGFKLVQAFACLLPDLSIPIAVGTNLSYISKESQRPNHKQFMISATPFLVVRDGKIVIAH